MEYVPDLHSNRRILDKEEALRRKEVRKFYYAESKRSDLSFIDKLQVVEVVPFPAVHVRKVVIIRGKIYTDAYRKRLINEESCFLQFTKSMWEVTSRPFVLVFDGTGCDDASLPSLDWMSLWESSLDELFLRHLKSVFMVNVPRKILMFVQAKVLSSGSVLEKRQDLLHICNTMNDVSSILEVPSNMMELKEALIHRHTCAVIHDDRETLSDVATTTNQYKQSSSTFLDNYDPICDDIVKVSSLPPLVDSDLIRPPPLTRCTDTEGDGSTIFSSARNVLDSAVNLLPSFSPNNNGDLESGSASTHSGNIDKVNVVVTLDEDSEQRLKHAELYNEALRMDLTSVYKRRIMYTIDAKYTTSGRPVLIITGCRVDSTVDRHQILLFFMRLMEPLWIRPYDVIYFHTGANMDNVPPVEWFTQSRKALRRDCRKNLSNIYIVQPSLMLKSLVSCLRPFVSSKVFRKVHFCEAVEDVVRETGIDYPRLPADVVNSATGVDMFIDADSVWRASPCQSCLNVNCSVYPCALFQSLNKGLCPDCGQSLQSHEKACDSCALKSLRTLSERIDAYTINHPRSGVSGGDVRHHLVILAMKMKWGSFILESMDLSTLPLSPEKFKKSDSFLLTVEDATDNIKIPTIDSLETATIPTTL